MSKALEKGVLRRHHGACCCACPHLTFIIRPLTLSIPHFSRRQQTKKINFETLLALLTQMVFSFLKRQVRVFSKSATIVQVLYRLLKMWEELITHLSNRKISKFQKTVIMSKYLFSFAKQQVHIFNTPSQVCKVSG